MKKIITTLCLMLFVVNFTLAQSTIPSYKWLHPKPFGASMGYVKVWDANNFYAFGSAGNFLKSTDAGQTFTINPTAGVPFGVPYTTYNDIYGAHFFDQTTGYTCGVYGVSKTTDGGQTFNQVGAGYFSTATLRDIQFLDQNVGYVVGTSTAKLAVTTDAGNTWTINSSLPATTYYNVHAFNQNKIIVCGTTNASANIRVTTDGGATWTAVAAGTGTLYSLAFFDSLTGFASAGSGKAFKTTDGGFTWNEMLNIGSVSTSTFYSSFIEGSNYYLVEDDSTLFISSDSGATFTSHKYLPTGKRNLIIRSGAASGSTIFLAGDWGYYFVSNDGGNTWQTQSEVDKTGFIQAIYGDQTGKIIAAGPPSSSTTGQQLIVSDDFGANFTSVSLPILDADLRGIYMHNAVNGYTCGSGGRIWKTTDGGYSWNLYGGTTTIQAFASIDFYDNQYGMVSGNSGQIFKTTDDGINWTSVSNTGSTAGMNGLAMIDSITAITAGGTNVFKTTNGGTSWTTITPGVPIGPIARVRMKNPTTGYLVGGSGTSQTGYVFKTTDAGDTWTNLNFPYTTNMLYDINFRGDSDLVVVGFYGAIFHSTNDGINWTNYNVGSFNGFQSQMIGLTFVSQDTFIVGGAGSQLIKIALEPIVPVELSSFIASINSDNVSLFWTIATELNNRGFEIERKLSNTNDWEALGYLEGRGTTTEPKTYQFQDFNVISGRSYNYRIKQIDYDGSFTYYVLSQVIEFGSPIKFALEQNYPNPFNPSTTISFSIPQKSDVTVKIYDILGNEILKLVDDSRDAGKYNINFNASTLSSGVYFYSIKAGEFTETKKMTLIK